nr:MAG TPA: IrrE protein [Caudoviricetes sp.]
MTDFCEAIPLSNATIQSMVRRLKKKLGIKRDEYVNVLEILENKLPDMYPNFCLEIIPKEKMPNKHGLTIPETNEIKIREDVYEGAFNGNGRDRLTIMHEIFHFIFHRGNNIIRHYGFARMEKKLPAYRNPEWQANAFAGAFLMDEETIKNLTISEIMDKYGVTYSAAVTQKSKIH